MFMFYEAFNANVNLFSKMHVTINCAHGKPAKSLRRREWLWKLDHGAD